VSDLAAFLALRAGEFAAGGLLAITLIGSGGDDDVDAHPYLRCVRGVQHYTATAGTNSGVC
jgi:hypothetical protein